MISVFFHLFCKFKCECISLFMGYKKIFWYKLTSNLLRVIIVTFSMKKKSFLVDFDRGYTDLKNFCLKSFIQNYHILDISFWGGGGVKVDQGWNYATLSCIWFVNSTVSLWVYSSFPSMFYLNDDCGTILLLYCCSCWVCSKTFTSSIFRMIPLLCFHKMFIIFSLHQELHL